MKLVETKLSNGSTLSFVCFTADEEYAMAKWYMDVLCLPWLDTREEFQKFIEQTFWRKCRGKDFTLEQAAKLCDYNERYTDILPSFPKLKNNGKHITAPNIHNDGIEYSVAEKVEYIEWIIKNAWKETWDNHPDIKAKTRFKVFPGEQPTDEFVGKQKQLEDEFWDEVDSKQTEYGCDREQAIIAVSDYKPRPESQYRIPDPLSI